MRKKKKSSFSKSRWGEKVCLNDRINCELLILCEGVRRMENTTLKTVSYNAVCFFFFLNSLEHGNLQRRKHCYQYASEVMQIVILKRYISALKNVSCMKSVYGFTARQNIEAESLNML